MDLKSLFEEYKHQIEKLLPAADIQHVGGSSIPGAITKGDLDIQIRIRLEDMEAAITALDTIFERKHEELWNKNFAIFVDRKVEPSTDIMISVIDSAYDTFFRVRDLLIADAGLLEKYNELKKKYAAEPYAIFSKHKRAFFDELFETHLDLES
ncbi:MAG: GrpB family protein [Candidatus Pacebacteria bacterium]|jgi:GrpB-like predicted nucleotidyltransferase (UPF0157 family)|nr:GrpB family protein [Candidatus Paceibacterota bacterium]MBP9852112.1 GrpB family protein [Candidatus Paceibacterota bacterium]